MNTYVLFSCNIWKNSDSMRLMGVFSNLNTLKKNIKQLIKEGSFECSESFNMKWTIDEINNYVDYLFIETCSLNQIE